MGCSGFLEPSRRAQRNEITRTSVEPYEPKTSPTSERTKQSPGGSNPVGAFKSQREVSGTCRYSQVGGKRTSKPSAKREIKARAKLSADRSEALQAKPSYQAVKDK